MLTQILPNRQLQQHLEICSHCHSRNSFTVNPNLGRYICTNCRMIQPQNIFCNFPGFQADKTIIQNQMCGLGTSKMGIQMPSLPRYRRNTKHYQNRRIPVARTQENQFNGSDTRIEMMVKEFCTKLSLGERYQDEVIVLMKKLQKKRRSFRGMNYKAIIAALIYSITSRNQILCDFKFISDRIGLQELTIGKIKKQYRRLKDDIKKISDETPVWSQIGKYLIQVEYFVKKLNFDQHMKKCKDVMRYIQKYGLLDGKCPATQAGVAVHFVSKKLGQKISFPKIANAKDNMGPGCIRKGYNSIEKQLMSCEEFQQFQDAQFQRQPSTQNFQFSVPQIQETVKESISPIFKRKSIDFKDNFISVAEFF